MTKWGKKMTKGKYLVFALLAFRTQKISKHHLEVKKKNHGNYFNSSIQNVIFKSLNHAIKVFWVVRKMHQISFSTRVLVVWKSRFISEAAAEFEITEGERKRSCVNVKVKPDGDIRAVKVNHGSVYKWSLPSLVYNCALTYDWPSISIPTSGVEFGGSGGRSQWQRRLKSWFPATFSQKAAAFIQVLYLSSFVSLTESLH